MKSSPRLIPSLLALACLLAVPAFAAEPSSGTVSNGNRTAEWTGGPFQTGVPGAGCVTPADPTCDAFSLTVDLKPGRRFAVAIASEIEGDDYDLYVFYPDGTEAARSATSGGSEAVVIEHTSLHGSGPYHVRVQPWQVSAGSTYQGVARSTREAAIDPEDPNACLEATPDGVGVTGVTDSGQTVSLDVVVLLDGVDPGLANQIMTGAAQSYAPSRINLNVV